MSKPPAQECPNCGTHYDLPAEGCPACNMPADETTVLKSRIAQLEAALRDCMEAFDAEKLLQAKRGESVAVQIGIAHNIARAALSNAQPKESGK